MGDEVNATDCVSEDLGRAGASFVAISVFQISASIILVTSGGILWWSHRKSSYLSRRNPFAVCLLGAAVVANIFAGSAYRISLNSGELILNGCFLGNVCLAIVTPLMIIPNTTRIVSFHYRVSLNRTLSKLHREREEEEGVKRKKRKSSALRAPPSNPVLFRDKMISSVDHSSSGISDIWMFSQINLLKWRAGGAFSRRLAIGLLLFTVACGLFYGISSCPIPAFGLETCAYGYIEGLAILLLAVPIIPLLSLIIYFGWLIKQVPDPFRIKHEIKIFFFLLLAQIFFGFLSFMDIGGFQELDEEDVMFEWVQVLDFLLLVMFFHAVHVQVYYASKLKHSLENSIPFSLAEVIASPQGRNLFEVFLQADFSVENLLVYEVMADWRKAREKLDPENLKKIAKSDAEAKGIYRRWMELGNDDAIGINVSFQVLSSLKQVIEEESSYPETLFDEVAEDVFELMRRDSFLRFVNTEEYKVFIGLEDPGRLEDMHFDRYPRRRLCC